MEKKFRGTGVALVTPFRKYGTVDFNALTNLVNYVVDNGVEFLVALGTTSEAATLTHDEKGAVVSHILEVNKGRVPVVLGMGGNDTASVVNTIMNTDFTGIDGILTVAPYYNKPQPKGLYLHFKNIAVASPVPVILYNVPSRTSVNIPAEITLKLAEDIQNIVAVKEASGDLNQVMEIINNAPEDFSVLSGDDNLTMATTAMGGDGVISVVANAFPKDFSNMVRFTQKNKLQEAREIHYKLMNIIEALFMDGNPAGIKAALEIKGIIWNNLRLPLVKANKSVYNLLSSLIREYK